MASEKSTSVELHSKYFESGHGGRYEHRESFTLSVEPDVQTAASTMAAVVLEHVETDTDTSAQGGERETTKRYRLTGEKLAKLITASVKPE